MSEPLPRSTSRPIQTPEGEAIGISNRWERGQYCCILTKAGIVGCGIYDLPTCDEFGLAVAICRGTPRKPLVEPEDLFDSKIVGVSKKARSYGIAEGITGKEALRLMLLAAG